MSSIHYLFPLTVRKYNVPLRNDVVHKLISNYNTYVSKHHDGMAGAIRVCCIVARLVTLLQSSDNCFVLVSMG
jgi:hypothetical protein